MPYDVVVDDSAARNVCFIFLPIGAPHLYSSCAEVVEQAAADDVVLAMFAEPYAIVSGVSYLAVFNHDAVCTVCLNGGIDVCSGLLWGHTGFRGIVGRMCKAKVSELFVAHMPVFGTSDFNEPFQNRSIDFGRLHIFSRQRDID